jgi:phosphoribosylamine--glycine ligase
VKADGLAGGKGVMVCSDEDTAAAAIRAAMVEGAFGAAGRRVVVERALVGREVSVIAMCDATACLVLPAARDHKRLGDGDTGPNTGGMGAVSPVEDLPDELAAQLAARFHRPVLAELARRGIVFRGALYAGLMLTDDGPFLLEFNVRFGDPETQAQLPRLATPLAPLLAATARDELATQAAAQGIIGASLPVRREATAAVVLAAAGYPGEVVPGAPITGIEAARATGARVFCAGVAAGHRPQADLVTAGGRVLAVVGKGQDIPAAADAAYRAADLIVFQGRQLRRDIGRSAAGVAALGVPA